MVIYPEEAWHEELGLYTPMYKINVSGKNFNHLKDAREYHDQIIVNTKTSTSSWLQLDAMVYRQTNEWFGKMQFYT